MLFCVILLASNCVANNINRVEINTQINKMLYVKHLKFKVIIFIKFINKAIR